jgi:alpha-L-fucosidase
MSIQTVTRRHVLAALSTGPLLTRAAWAKAASGQAGADRTAWYREAKFGMFIHWGPYSLASVEASWPIMRPSKEFPITEEQYRSLPRQFNPTKFDPHAWIALAKSAHQRYMVFTTKHHDGFCMFDSAYTDYKITNTPYKKDIVAQLAEACGHEKMPVGFLLLTAGYESSCVPGHVQTLEYELERRADTRSLAHVSRLHGAAIAGIAHAVWRCRTDLVRRPI